MTRKKVTLAFIPNDSERKASFKKRKKGLIKKVSELSTLCGVEACAIIYSPYDAEPEVWPDLLGAQRVLARFRKLSEMDQARKMWNQESFTRQRIKKVEDQLRRLQKENKRREMENFMFQCIAGMVTLEEFPIADAAEMSWVVQQMLRDIKAKMDAMRRGEIPMQPEPQPEPQAPEPDYDGAGIGDNDLEGFPWNLVESPGAGGLGLDDGWDNEGMVLPYPFIFDHGSSGSGGN